MRGVRILEGTRLHEDGIRSVKDEARSNEADRKRLYDELTKRGFPLPTKTVPPNPKMKSKSEEKLR